MYLISLNYFRAIAIVLIVISHCYSGWNIDTFPERLITNLITGGTALFVFISGFLFHHIFYKNFNFKNFMLKKIKNVLVPYVLLSSPLIIYLVFYKQSGINPICGISSMFKSVLFYYVTGRTIFAYWYVPFIMCTFAMSPIHVYFIKSKHQIPIILILSSISCLIHRPIFNVSVLQSVVYFSPVYLFGIWCSLNREKIYSYFSGKECLLLASAIIMAAIQGLFFDNQGNFHKDPFSITAFDINFPQKILLCLFFMVFLKRLEGLYIKPLYFLSKISFPIFFIHPFVIKIFGTIQNKESVFLFISTPTSTPTVLIICSVLTLIVKRVLPKYSRQIIGY